MKFKVGTAIATVCASALLIPALSVPLSQAEPPLCNPTPHVSWPRGGLPVYRNIHYYQVKFGTTCGLDVSAYYHANNPPFGTYWIYGNTVRGLNQVSKLDRQVDGYCTYGYRFHLTNGWHNVKLGGPGC
jgi:hypothetical protein